MMTLTSIAALALALQSQPASTDDSAEVAATSTSTEATVTADAAEKAKDENRIICKRTAVVGSKFKKKLCGTAREWDQLAQRGSDTAAEMRKKGKGGAIGN